MKKFLAVVLVLAILGACGYAAYSYFDARPLFNDLETAKANLEAADYVVSLTERKEEPKNFNDLIAQQLTAIGEDDNALTIIEFFDEEVADIYYRQYKLLFDMEKKSAELDIREYEYKLEHDEDLTDSQIEMYNELIEDHKENLEKLENAVMGKSGNIIWYGTKDAVKASRG